MIVCCNVLVISIKCYVCKEPDRKCRDPFQNDTIFLKDCSQIGMGNATMCRKYMWESKKKKNVIFISYIQSI